MRNCSARVCGRMLIASIEHKPTPARMPITSIEHKPTPPAAAAGGTPDLLLNLIFRHVVSGS